MYAARLPPALAILDSTTGTEIVARVTRLTSVCEPRRRRSVTFVPSGPLMSAVAASSLRPASLRPFARVMTSPTRIPAFSAGDFG